MNLTLEIEDLEEDIFVQPIITHLPISQMAYHLNNQFGFNFKKQRDKTPFLPVGFNHVHRYIHGKDNDVICLLENHPIVLEHNQESLFGETLTIETKKILFRSFKKANLLVLSNLSLNDNVLKNPNHGKIGITKSHKAMTKKEQLLIENIYYDQQS